MENIVKNKVTHNDIVSVYEYKNIDWRQFDGKTFYITGATGTIGSFLIRVLRHVQKYEEININIVASARNKALAETFYKDILLDPRFKLHVVDINNPVSYKGKIDYIIHTACATSSKSFVENPVEVFNTATKGTENILKLAKEHNIESMVFLSSMEVYGDIDDDKKVLKETDLGNIDVQNPRSSYPMGKRAAETLCFSYANEYNVPVKVARLAQVIGANVDYNDGRVYAQFARSVVEKRDIVLNTTAQTIRSYCYITDIATGIFTLLSKGNNGEVYNLANENASIRIKDMAQMLCDKYPNTNLKIELTNPNMYYKETYWNLDTSKIKSLGWNADVSLNEAYNRLVTSFYMQKSYGNSNIVYANSKRRKITFLQRIFSILNYENKKHVRILGLHFKLELNRKNLYKKYANLPVKKNKIVFNNYMGNNFGCNSKYLTEEILKRKLPVDIVWLVKKTVPTDNFPSNVRVVDYSSKNALFELATAKIWVDNYHKIFFIKRGLEKKDGQKYIQTWHGSLGIKKIEKVVDCLTQDPFWVECAQKNSEMTDYWISNSKFETAVYQESFWNVKNILELGHPRNDVFFTCNENIKEKVYECFNIDRNKKIALYVPSFREDEGLEYYTLDYLKVISELNNKFGSDFVFITRLHPRVAKYSSLLLPESIIDGSLYPDIQELLYAADVVFTDYSSCIFDFMLSKKPAFIFATDIESYNNERGFYYPLESTPFPVACNNEELVENIKNFDIEKYKNDVDNFLKDKGCMEDGQASKRVVDLIEDIFNA